MKDMFYKYNNRDLPDIPSTCHHHNKEIEAAPSISLVTNVKGEVIGIQVKKSNPFTLYFNLEDFGSAFKTTGMSLADIILTSTISVELYTLTGVNILNKTYSPFDVFDEYGCYLALDFTPEDLSVLKKESYRLSVKLLFGESQYEIFSQADSLLIVR